MRDSAPCCKKWGSPLGPRRRRLRLRPAPQPLLHPRRRRRSPPPPPRRWRNAPAAGAGLPRRRHSTATQRPRPRQDPPPRPPPSPPPKHPPPPPVALTCGALKLHAAQALSPAADPAQTPAGLGSGWLIVAESLTPAEPLGGAAGRLLDNMLRAMQLH